jgi:hypothetical protein
MKITVALVALMMAFPAAAGPTPLQLMVGRWRSADDPRAMVEVRADGTWIDSYTGAPSATAASRWVLFSGAHPPKAAADETLDAKSTYLEVSDEDGGQLFYALEKVDAKSLKLLYLDRGNELTYERAPARPAASRPRP